MATTTPRTMIDPNDDSIETSLDFFEQKLRWWSPLLLGFFQTFWPYAYRSAVGISTIVGYMMFFIPSLIGASLITDVATDEALFTTLSLIGDTLVTIGTVLPFVEPLVTVGLLTALYIVFVFDYDPVEPNGTSVSSPYEWQRLRWSYIPCLLLFIGSAVATVSTTIVWMPIVSIASAWWITRRLTFTTVWDQSRYLVSPPYTEVLLASRVPFGVGVLLFVFNITTIGAIVCMSVPFLVTIAYLRWRRWAGDDNSHTLPDKRMHRDSVVGSDIASDYTAAGAYRAYGNEELIREAVRKYNSFLDTEIDTTRRITISDSRLTLDDLDRIQSEAHDIYGDFNSVAYRPQRFEDLVDTIDKYSNQLREVIEEDEQATN